MAIFIAMAHLEDDRDGHWAMRRVPGRFYVSQRFSHRLPDGSESDRVCRFAYQVFDASGEVIFENQNGWEVVLRETPSRQQLKALFFQDDRGIERIAFQRFDRAGKRIVRESFRLEGPEVQELGAFLGLIQSNALDLAEAVEGARLLPSGIDALIGDESSREELFNRYRDVLVELVENQVDAPELLNLARRRKQLECFERLLQDPEFFDSERERLRNIGKQHGPENVWQQFFEFNRWIFGAGLATQFLHAWDPRRLEQTSVGASAFSHGKRPDALMLTAGALSGLVFVEIKTHQDSLVDKTYRAGVWPPSSEVTGGVAQCQTTVDETTRQTERLVARLDAAGFPESEAVVCRPRSILVVGSLKEFFDEQGNLSLERFVGFERFRRSLRDPEIVTFDELFERARMVLDLAGESLDS
jgi:Domain of unknown function (DUF4263)